MPSHKPSPVIAEVLNIAQGLVLMLCKSNLHDFGFGQGPGKSCLFAETKTAASRNSSSAKMAWNSSFVVARRSASAESTT